MANGLLPTVADADLVLGYLNPDNFLGGRMKLHAGLARRAIDEHVATPLGLSVEQAAEGIKTIIDARMADLIRQATVEQGYDPSDFVLYAYGGAGPLHAFSYGAELGIRKVVVPVTASVHSAFGIAVSDLTVAEEMSAPILSPPGTTDYSTVIRPEMVQASFDRLTARAFDRLREEGADLNAVTTSRSVEMRFRFQIHALTIPVPEEKLDAAAIDRLVRRFIDTYEARFGKGSAFTAAGIELTTYRVVAGCDVARPELRNISERAETGPAAPSERQVHIQGHWRPACVLLPNHLRVGARIDGIAIIEMPDTTVVIGPGQHATMDDRGNVVLELAP